MGAGAGIASPSIHHFFSPLMRVQIKVFPLYSLTVLKPSVAAGHVRPGAAESCGYPSSRFAAVAGEVKERLAKDVNAKAIRNSRFKIMIYRRTLLVTTPAIGESEHVSPRKFPLLG
ncbi:unannotated protein [freshwater metagenome]|uniref:Unannotated protein n=1 Tax=freshwater metagenome TaxID=449393 RepID=A0A6J7KJB5_9ZZZZ